MAANATPTKPLHIGQAWRPKCYALLFIPPGRDFNGRVPEDVDLEIVELPMAKMAEIESTTLIDKGNAANKIYHAIDKWLKVAKQVVQARFQMPNVGEAVMATGSTGRALISCKQAKRFSKDEMIRRYGQEAYDECCLPSEPYIEIRLQDAKDEPEA